MPVVVRSLDSSATSASGTGPCTRVPPWGAQRARAPPPVAAGVVRSRGASLAVFHSPHTGQRPNQRGCSFPHAAQKNDVFEARPAFAGLLLIFMEALVRGAGARGRTRTR